MAKKTALIIVDVQNDFCEGGSLAVSGAKEIIPLINQLRQNPMFDLVIRTRDWHPITHVSFAANHPEMKVFQIKYLEDTGVDQVMWPVHCVQGTKGADFHQDLYTSNSDIIVSKGQLDRVDSYSGFGSRPEITNLESILRENNVDKVYCVGLAFDYCVGSTARDAALLGFDTYLIKDATRSVAADSEQKMISSLIEAGVKLINSIQTKQRTNGSLSLMKKLDRANSQLTDVDERCLPMMGESAGLSPEASFDPYDRLPKSLRQALSENEAQFTCA